MSDTAQDEKRPLHGWEVDSLRFTSYTTSPDEPTGLEDWWRSVSERGERSVLHEPGKHLERGSIGDEELALQWQPWRIDWKLLPIDPGPRDEEEVNPTVVSRKSKSSAETVNVSSSD